MEIAVMAGLLAEGDMDVDSGHIQYAVAIESTQLAVGSRQLFLIDSGAVESTQ
jgi:hypothetical protein